MGERAINSGIISILPKSICIPKRIFGVHGRLGVKVLGESPVVVIAETLSTNASEKV